MSINDPIYPANGQFFTPDELEIIARMPVARQSINQSQTNSQFSTMDSAERDFKLGQTNPYLYGGKMNQNFAIDKNSARSFSFTLTNATPGGGTARTLIAALFGGYRQSLGTIPGLIKTGAFTDKNGNNGLSCQSNEIQTIEDLQAFLRHEPSELKAIGFRFLNNSTQQVSSKITVTKMSPFGSGEESVIASVSPQLSADPANANDKILFVDLAKSDIVASYDKLIEYPVQADSSVQITLYFGMSLSPSTAMERFAKDGQNIVALVGQSNLAAAGTAAQLVG